MMTPVGALMIEHRLIERMVHLLEAQVQFAEGGGRIDPDFIDAAVGFIRTYADRCHHGKEEEILFRELESRPLEAPYKQTLHELIQEHVQGRQMTARLAEANARYRGGEEGAVADIIAVSRELADFYPRHIDKEDHHFFVPTMDCFSKKDLAEMLERFWEFDRQLIHEQYRAVVGQWEAQRPAQGQQ
jgi:hemerythrin-like domain-containing protein